MNYKEQFEKIFKENIKREGADKLLDWLEKSDFFTAPASTKFHSAHEGGLCEHSVKVYHRYLNLIKNEFGENFEEKISKESIALVSLCHDVCKVNTYKIEYRNDNHIYKAKPVGHLYFQSAYRPLKGKSLCRQQKVQAESDYKGTSAK